METFFMMYRNASSAFAVRVAFLMAVVSANAVSEQHNPRGAQAPPQSPGANAMFDDKLFQQVPLDTNEQTACSPTEPGVDWRGVLVRAPSQVILPDQRTKDSALIVPLCGLYFVDVVSALRHPGHRILVVTDDKTGHVYRGEIVKKDPHPTIPPPPSPPLDPALYADQAYGSYFNINVASYVALPLRPARYRVRVEYAGHQSNEVRIAVIERR
jgi:hypothetical protein